MAPKRKRGQSRRAGFVSEKQRKAVMALLRKNLKSKYRAVRRHGKNIASMTAEHLDDAIAAAVAAGLMTYGARKVGEYVDGWNAARAAQARRKPHSKYPGRDASGRYRTRR